MRECFGGEVNYIFRDTLSLSLSPAAEVVSVHQACPSLSPRPVGGVRKRGRWVCGGCSGRARGRRGGG